MHVKGKQEDGSAQIAACLDAVKTSTENAPVVGHLPKDKHQGAFAELVEKSIKESGLSTVDASAGFADVFAVKSAPEILNVKKAALLASKVMKDFVQNELEKIIDDDRKIKHSKLAELTEEVIANPAKVQLKLKAENLDIAYPPVFQSGGVYDLKVGTLSDDNSLHGGVVVVALGTRYASYCANISRTFVVDPTADQKAHYEALLKAQEAAIAALVPGAPMSAAYAAAVAALTAAGQAPLVDKLSKSVGFGMGLEFRESANVLNAKNEGVVRSGMVFNVCVGISGLENAQAESAKGKVYAMQLADTIVVPLDAGKAPENATSSCPRALSTVSYELNQAEEDEDEEEDGGGAAAAGRGARRAQLRSEEATEAAKKQSAEAQRKEKQAELLRQKNEETLRRLTAAGGAAGAAGASTSGRAVSSIVAYRSVAEMPAVRDLVITTDQKAEAVLLPLYGLMVPFHISTIKAATSSNDSDHAYVRITFNFSGAYEPALKFPASAFVKDLSFKVADPRRAARAVQEIKLLRSSVAQRDKERAERATLVAQEKLIPGKRTFTLDDCWIRPGFPSKGRKVTGKLTAHTNGFR